MRFTDEQIAKLGNIVDAAAAAFKADPSGFDFMDQVPNIPGLQRWVWVLLLNGEEPPPVKIGGGISLGIYIGMKFAESERMEREFCGETKS